MGFVPLPRIFKITVHNFEVSPWLIAYLQESDPLFRLSLASMASCLLMSPGRILGDQRKRVEFPLDS